MFCNWNMLRSSAYSQRSIVFALRWFRQAQWACWVWARTASDKPQTHLGKAWYRWVRQQWNFHHTVLPSWRPMAWTRRSRSATYKEKIKLSSEQKKSFQNLQIFFFTKVWGFFMTNSISLAHFCLLAHFWEVGEIYAFLPLSHLPFSHIPPARSCVSLPRSSYSEHPTHSFQTLCPASLFFIALCWQRLDSACLFNLNFLPDAVNKACCKAFPCPCSLSLFPMYN